MVRWTPRGEDPETFHTLVDGVPPWLVRDIQAWASQVSQSVNFSHFSRAFDRDTRGAYAPARRGSSVADVLRYLDKEDWLDYIEYILFYLEDNHIARGAAYSEDLDGILLEGSSKWKVGRRGEYAGLEDRVPAGVVAAIDDIVARGTSAGELLAEAWTACFGRTPDYEDAYEKAIKAVEEAGASRVAPKNASSTLGTMTRDMENQADWRLPLGEDPRHPSGDVPTGMARALWSGQQSRHGGNGYRKPTREEAEAAVLLAVPLVQWFESGVLARRP